MVRSGHILKTGDIEVFVTFHQIELLCSGPGFDRLSYHSPEMQKGTQYIRSFSSNKRKGLKPENYEKISLISGINAGAIQFQIYDR